MVRLTTFEKARRELIDERKYDMMEKIGGLPLKSLVGKFLACGLGFFLFYPKPEESKWEANFSDK